MAMRVRELGRRPYEEVWQAMRAYTEERGPESADELWLVEHPPVFTQGRNGDPAHILGAGDIPVVPTDRGGQVTYHGPGQLVAYPLVDLRRRGRGVRDHVHALEQAVIDLLALYQVPAERHPGAPGVYVPRQGLPAAKIASLGIRVRHGRTYHGVALNLDLDLAPFARINPCGYTGQPVTRLADWVAGLDPEEAKIRLTRTLLAALAPEEDALHAG
jgi:lipoyl(octanoyl) transferase